MMFSCGFLLKGPCLIKLYLEQLAYASIGPLVQNRFQQFDFYLAVINYIYITKMELY